MTNKNILITSAGQRVSLIKACQSEIKKINPEGKIFTVDCNPVLAPACHISDGYAKVKKVTEEGYFEELMSICELWNIGIVIPTIDTELIVMSKVKGSFAKKSIELIVSNPDFVSLCRDKRLLNNFFIDHNIEIPAQYSKDDLRYPLFIKPYDGSLSAGTYLVKSSEFLTPEHIENSKAMFMEYIDPMEYSEYTVDTYYNRKGYLKSAVPRKRIFVRSGEINKGVTRNNCIVPFIKEKLYYIKGAVGCLTMQFFLKNDNSKILGIEINPRFGGGYPLSYLAGANFPGMLIQEYLLNQEVEANFNWEDNLLMLRYDDEVLVHNYEG